MAKNQKESKINLTRDQLIERLFAGQIMCVGKYWSGRIEKIMVRDKTSTTGARRVSYLIRQTILTDADPLTLTEFAPDGFDPDSWDPPFAKNEDVVALVKGIESKEGVVKLRGELVGISA